MDTRVGIRREDKNEWERRTPIIPEHLRELAKKYPLKFILQPSRIRAFSDEDYVKAGAAIKEQLSECSVIFAIKEIPPEFFEPHKTYVFFSHTIKGQRRNMPMLKKIMQLGCQLIDYEKVVDAKGGRLIFFGRHAGIAGMIDTLWAMGQRLKVEGIETPLCKINRAWEYKSLEAAKEEISLVGEAIKNNGLPLSVTPLICGIAGYGNVSAGAQEILELLPVEELKPSEIALPPSKRSNSQKVIYKVVFKEEDMVERPSSPESFNLQHYYENPQHYKSKFHNYIPLLSMLVNAIYWDPRYPRFFTKSYLKELFEQERKPRLKVVGDISSDVGGSIEFTVKNTTPANPAFVYNPQEDKAHDGLEGRGIAVLAVDNLPCEIPLESSMYFSNVLKKYVPPIAMADYSKDFSNCVLPEEIKKAVLVYQGKLTENYKYLEKFL